ncbi:hypothetical protein [Actinokineospora iranica]|uniref:hypothetical protein n=1 Tax=Actinokineospora iranica TaxID=1271860 RepID=UPI000B836D77|nr:hypothetical protein [Actinokineospora iranica]
MVREIDHDSFEIDDVTYVIRELVWNGIDGRSYDLHRVADDVVLTEDKSFNAYPTNAQVAEVLTRHGVDVELEVCVFCEDDVLLATAHRHGRGWVGDSCCWDERLRATE